MYRQIKMTRQKTNKEKTKISTIKFQVTDRGSPNKQNPCHAILRGVASTRVFVF